MHIIDLIIMFLLFGSPILSFKIGLMVSNYISDRKKKFFYFPALLAFIGIMVYITFFSWCIAWILIDKSNDIHDSKDKPIILINKVCDKYSGKCLDDVPRGR